MNAHDAWTLVIFVLCSAVFVILLVEAFRGIWSLSKTTPVTANEAPTPLRTVLSHTPPRIPPRRPARRSRDRSEAELLPEDATVTFAAERRAADIDDVFEALDGT